MPKAPIYLIDASGFVFRSFYALPNINNEKGQHVGAVFGFFQMLLQLIERKERCLLVFDTGFKNFRHDLYPEYKANRKSPPVELIEQFDLIREACDALALQRIEVNGMEADDIIATFARLAPIEDEIIIIYSSDKDLYQLISPNVRLYDPMKKKDITEEDVLKKFGVPSNKVRDILALMGDASDNIPGVKGIGPKTACELIQEFQSVENLLNNLSSIKTEKRRNTLETHKRDLNLSYQLVGLHDHVPLPLDLKDILPIDPHHEKASLYFRTLGLTKLSRYFSEKSPSQSFVDPNELGTIVQHSLFHEWAKRMKESGLFSLTVIATSSTPNRANLVGISFAFYDAHKKRQSFYVPLPQGGPPPSFFEEIKILLEDKILKKVGHTLKYDLQVIQKLGTSDLCSYDDIMLMSYALYTGSLDHDLDMMALRMIHHTMTPQKDLLGGGKKQKTWEEIDVDKVALFATERSLVILKLYDLLNNELEKMPDLCHLYQEIERPLVPVIASMEQWGILVDRTRLNRLGDFFKEQQKKLEATIIQECGVEFNPSSPKQVSDILFNKLLLTKPKKTKTGAYSTDNDVLQRLADEGSHVCSLLLQFRHFSKLDSTYVEGLLPHLDKNDRIHTSFLNAKTATGRFASSDPNLQNIPVREEDGRRIRSCFVAKDHFKLVSFDYSQIELRLLAHMAPIPSLIEAFERDQDIHQLTASQIFKIPLDQVSPEERRRAKTINFGIIYGMSYFGLSQQLGVSQRDAKKMIDEYFENYPEIRDYIEHMSEQARLYGYVETLFKRRCFISGISDKNPLVRQFAKRQAVNAPLQGSNADIIKRVMGPIHERIKNEEGVRLLLQIHDELLFEIREDLLDLWTPCIQKIMEEGSPLTPKIKVNVKVNDRWI